MSLIRWQRQSRSLLCNVSIIISIVISDDQLNKHIINNRYSRRRTMSPPNCKKPIWFFVFGAVSQPFFRRSLHSSLIRQGTLNNPPSEAFLTRSGSTISDYIGEILTFCPFCCTAVSFSCNSVIELDISALVFLVRFIFFLSSTNWA